MSGLDDTLKDPNEEVSQFGEKVFNYCLQKFGLIYEEHIPSKFFTEEIGNAVVILQLHIRDFLRDNLYRALEKIVGVIDSNQRLQAIGQLLEWDSKELFEQHSIHTVLLGYLALITELIIFMDSAGLPVQMDWFKHIWTSIYDSRLKQEFGESWEELQKDAKKVCDECPRKEELFEELKVLEHPYAEIDPRIETSFKELDPFFMFYALRLGYEFPRKAGLSDEALDRLLRSRGVDVDA